MFKIKKNQLGLMVLLLAFIFSLSFSSVNSQTRSVNSLEQARTELTSIEARIKAVEAKTQDPEILTGLRSVKEDLSSAKTFADTLRTPTDDDLTYLQGSFDYITENLLAYESMVGISRTDSPISDLSDQLVILTDNNLPAAQVGRYFAQNFQASGGEQPYTWSFVPLPKGLAKQHDNILSGTPNVAGTYTINVTVTDRSGNQVTKNMLLIVNPDGGDNPSPEKVGEFKILTYRISNWGAVGRRFKTELQAIGASTPYRWQVVEGSFPAGLKITNREDSFVLEGVPTRSGKYIFTVNVTDSNDQIVTKQVQIVIEPTEVKELKRVLWFLSQVNDETFNKIAAKFVEHLKTPEEQMAMQKKLAALKVRIEKLLVAVAERGGIDNLTKETLLALKEQIFAVKYDYKNTLIYLQEASGDYKFERADTHLVSRPLEIVGLGNFNYCVIGQEYQAALLANGGNPLFSWSLVGDRRLPSGLTLTPDGKISGVVENIEPKIYWVEVKVVDTYGEVAKKQISFIVNEPLQIVADDVVSITAGQPFSLQLKDKGGLPPHTWSVAGGLPEGATFFKEAGIISGFIPADRGAGSYVINVRAESGANPEIVASQSIILKVDPAPVYHSQADSDITKVSYNLQEDVQRLISLLSALKESSVLQVINRENPEVGLPMRVTQQLRDLQQAINDLPKEGTAFGDQLHSQVRKEIGLIEEILGDVSQYFPNINEGFLTAGPKIIFPKPGLADLLQIMTKIKLTLEKYTPKKPGNYQDPALTGTIVGSAATNIGFHLDKSIAKTKWEEEILAEEILSAVTDEKDKNLVIKKGETLELSGVYWFDSVLIEDGGELAVRPWIAQYKDETEGRFEGRGNLEIHARRFINKGIINAVGRGYMPITVVASGGAAGDEGAAGEYSCTISTGGTGGYGQEGFFNIAVPQQSGYWGKRALKQNKVDPKKLLAGFKPEGTVKDQAEKDVYSALQSQLVIDSSGNINTNLFDGTWDSFDSLMKTKLESMKGPSGQSMYAYAHDIYDGLILWAFYHPAPGGFVGKGGYNCGGHTQYKATGELAGSWFYGSSQPFQYGDALPSGAGGYGPDLNYIYDSTAKKKFLNTHVYRYDPPLMNDPTAVYMGSAGGASSTSGGGGGGGGGAGSCWDSSADGGAGGKGGQGMVGLPGGAGGGKVIIVATDVLKLDGIIISHGSKGATAISNNSNNGNNGEDGYDNTGQGGQGGFRGVVHPDTQRGFYGEGEQGGIGDDFDGNGGGGGGSSGYQISNLAAGGGGGGISLKVYRDYELNTDTSAGYDYGATLRSDYTKTSSLTIKDNPMSVPESYPVTSWGYPHYDKTGGALRFVYAGDVVRGLSELKTLKKQPGGTLEEYVLPSITIKQPIGGEITSLNQGMDILFEVAGGTAWKQKGEGQLVKIYCWDPGEDKTRDLPHSYKTGGTWRELKTITIKQLSEGFVGSKYTRQFVAQAWDTTYEPKTTSASQEMVKDTQQAQIRIIAFDNNQQYGLRISNLFTIDNTAPGQPYEVALTLDSKKKILDSDGKETWTSDLNPTLTWRAKDNLTEINKVEIAVKKYDGTSYQWKIASFEVDGTIIVGTTVASKDAWLNAFAFSNTYIKKDTVMDNGKLVTSYTGVINPKFRNLEHGRYQVLVRVWDQADNISEPSEGQLYNVDKQGPYIEFLDESGKPTTSTGWYRTLSALVTDESGVADFVVTLDKNQVYQKTLSSPQYTLTVPLGTFDKYLTNGSHTFVGTANDLFVNPNSKTSLVNVDVSSPEVTINFPVNQQKYIDSIKVISIEAIDLPKPPKDKTLSGMNTSKVELQLWRVVSEYMKPDYNEYYDPTATTKWTKVISGSSTVWLTTSSLGSKKYQYALPKADYLTKEAVYWVTVRGYDNAGNFGTATISFEVDLTPPVVNLEVDEVAVSAAKKKQWYTGLIEKAKTSGITLTAPLQAKVSEDVTMECEIIDTVLSSKSPGKFKTTLKAGAMTKDRELWPLHNSEFKFSYTAWDGAGNSTKEADLNISIDTLDPTIEVTSPGSGTEVSLQTIEVVATDPPANDTKTFSGVDSVKISMTEKVSGNWLDVNFTKGIAGSKVAAADKYIYATTTVKNKGDANGKKKFTATLPKILKPTTATDYRIYITASDEAENEGSYGTNLSPYYELTLDPSAGTKPKIDLKDGSGAIYDSVTDWYRTSSKWNQYVSFYLEAEEQGTGQGIGQIVLTTKEAAAKAVVTSYPYTSNNPKRTESFNLYDGKYSVSYYATSYKNTKVQSDIGTKSINVDTGKPTIKVSYPPSDDKNPEFLIDKITFEATDALSGVRSVEVKVYQYKHPSQELYYDGKGNWVADDGKNTLPVLKAKLVSGNAWELSLVKPIEETKDFDIYATAIDYAGNQETAKEYTISVDSSQKPVTPEVTIALDSGAVKLSWPKIKGAAKYNISRATNIPNEASYYKFLSPVTDDGSASYSYSDSAVVGTTDNYFYIVKAESKNTVSSDASNKVGIINYKLIRGENWIAIPLKNASLTTTNKQLTAKQLGDLMVFDITSPTVMDFIKKGKTPLTHYYKGSADYNLDYGNCYQVGLFTKVPGYTKYFSLVGDLPEVEKALFTLLPSPVKNYIYLPLSKIKDVKVVSDLYGKSNLSLLSLDTISLIKAGDPTADTSTCKYIVDGLPGQTDFIIPRYPDCYKIETTKTGSPTWP